MTSRDYQLLNLRYSCPLLRREDMLAGKVPTAPTIASMMAAMEVQEALKLIHGMPVQAGCLHVFNGVANTFYTTKLPRRDDCLSHETYPEPIAVDLGNGSSAEELFHVAHQHLSGPLSLALDRDLVAAIEWPQLGRRREVFRPRTRVTQAEATDEETGEAGRPELSTRSTRARSWRGGPWPSSASRRTISSASTGPTARRSCCWRPTGSGPCRDRSRASREQQQSDDIVFEEVSYREPHRLRRPDRDRTFACLAYGTPGPDDLAIFLDRRTADADRAARPERHLGRAGRDPAGQGVRRRGDRPAVRLGHRGPGGQALREHAGQLHLHARLLGGDHPGAGPEASRSSTSSAGITRTRTSASSCRATTCSSSSTSSASRCRWPTSSTRSARPAASSSGGARA